jgi:transcriptional regulator of NAD metabolism
MLLLNTCLWGNKSYAYDKNLYDIQSFVKRVEEYNAEPLLSLTKGVHLHTIEAESEEIINNIVKELKSKGYLIEEY